MTTNAQLIRKIAQGEILPEAEIQQLERAIGNYERSSEIVAAHSELGTRRLRIQFPIELIYSQLLEEDKASIIVPVPSEYKHLMIFGQGRITGASGGTVFCQFNGDTGNNYQWVYVLGNGTTVTSGQDTSDPRIPIGQFSNTGDPAGSSSSFEAKVMNYSAGHHQMVHAYTLYNDNTTRSVYHIAGKWGVISPIESLRIFAADGTGVDGSTNIAKDSLISVYGLR